VLGTAVTVAVGGRTVGSVVGGAGVGVGVTVMPGVTVAGTGERVAVIRGKAGVRGAAVGVGAGVCVLVAPVVGRGVTVTNMAGNSACGSGGTLTGIRIASCCGRLGRRTRSSRTTSAAISGAIGRCLGLVSGHGR
jgi:hypothetical protein